jgi:hypothetical protein
MRQDPAKMLAAMRTFPDLVDPAAWAFWWDEIERQEGERSAGRILVRGDQPAERPSPASVPHPTTRSGRPGR